VDGIKNNVFSIKKQKKKLYFSFNNKKIKIFRLLLFHSLSYFILISLFSCSFSSFNYALKKIKNNYKISKINSKIELEKNRIMRMELKIMFFQLKNKKSILF
jgi:hypothetical protein